MRNKTKFYLYAAFIIALTLSISDIALAGETYKWQDDKGVLHFTDNIFNVPARYRSQVEEKSYGDVQRYEGNDDVKVLPTTNSGRKKTKSNLKEIRVPYRPYEGNASRIIIPVTFNGSVTANMLLDTGAPGMVITPALADRIGLFDRDDGKLIHQAGGIGGRVPAILTIVDKVSVKGATTKFLPTTITEMFSGAYEGLIGMDFMANYDMEIDSRSRTIVFRELPASSNRPAGRGEYWWRSKYRIFAGLKKAWENYYNRLDDISPNTTMLERIKKIAKSQARESEKLYKQLERYATQHAVPRQWRQ